MRHLIAVVGSQALREQALPQVRLLDDESVRESIWYACPNQDDPSVLLDDTRSAVLRTIRIPVLAYRFYLLVQNTKLWGGKRPLILLRDRNLSSRIAAYAGSWGGGDVVKAGDSNEPALGPTRYILQPDGKLQLIDV